MTACAHPGPNPYVQPQTVTGPCTVKSFFIVPLRATPTEMKVENTGEPCVVSMFNPDLGAVQDAAFVTSRPTHGQVVTQVQGGDRGSVIVVYKPAQGYSGPDSFLVTFEPEARDVLFNVMIAPPAASGHASGAN
jgi:hypothetical protein